MADKSNQGDSEESREYQTLILLDELESLLEDLEEQGIKGLEAAQDVPEGIEHRMKELGVRDIQQVREKLMRLHVQVDEDDSDLMITES